MIKQETSNPARPVFEIDAVRTLWIIFICLLSLIVLMFMLDYFINWHEASSREGIRKMFSTTQEHSIAGWFAATLTFVVALAALAVALITNNHAGSRWRKPGWFLIAAFFAYLSVDDGAAIHENLGGGLKQTPVIGDAITAYSSYSWHIVILPFFVAVGVLMLIFLWRELEQRNQKLGVLAAFSCLGVAIVQDYIEGTTEEYDWFEIHYGMDAEAILHFAKSLEECLEMLGMVFFLLVFLSQLMRIHPRITLNFKQ